MRCKLSRALVMPASRWWTAVQTGRRAEAPLSSSARVAFLDRGVESAGERAGAGAAQ
jgi:hypothetical protein